MCFLIFKTKLSNQVQYKREKCGCCYTVVHLNLLFHLKIILAKLFIDLTFVCGVFGFLLAKIRYGKKWKVKFIIGKIFTLKNESNKKYYIYKSYSPCRVISQIFNTFEFFFFLRIFITVTRFKMDKFEAN